MYRMLIAICLMLYVTSHVNAQSLPVGAMGLDDFYRREQLLGRGDSSFSYTIRPAGSSARLGYSDMFYPDTGKIGFNEAKMRHVSLRPVDTNVVLRLLPLNFQFQFNSHHPHGWNDGAMIPARGVQTLLSGGLFLKFKIFSVQLKPEIVFAENPEFPGFPTDHYDVVWAWYYDYYNFTDLPERFGTKSYTRVLWGQSNMRLTFDPVSVGISTENLWWGPGIRNSLLMSNTSPGFEHLTFNTTRPVKTPAGTIEGQLVAGKLYGSGFAPLEPGRSYFGDSLYLPKPDDWRYFSGLVFSFQPKWVPGLFIGFSRSFQKYSKDLGSGIGEYIPIFFPFQRTRGDQAINKRDQMGSVFFRWLWQNGNGEIYFEYGRNDFSQNFRDFLLEPQNSRAYIFGLRKMLPLRKREHENILISLEVAQLQQTSVRTVSDAGAWYLHKYIRHGYTNKGQTLGAGIGPGSNLQSLEISWTRGLNRVGLQLERYVHNNDFYYYAFSESQDWRRHWTDLSAAFSGEWVYRHFIFSAKAQYLRALNYQWYLLQMDPDKYFTNGRERSNVQLQMGFMYRF